MKPQAPSSFLRLTLRLLASALATQAADIPYTGAGTDDNWTTNNNWQGDTPPANSSTGAAFWNDDTHTLIDSGTEATCNGFMLGMYGSTNSAEMTGGTLRDAEKINHPFWGTGNILMNHFSSPCILCI